MPERKIGELFEFDGRTLKCEKDEDMCEGCFFDNAFSHCTGDVLDIIGPCVGESRSDKTGVIFKLVTKEDNL